MSVDIDFKPGRGLGGVLTIRATGVADIAIDDELWYQVSHLARAAGDLARGRAAAVSYWTQPGAYDLTLEGDEVVVTGDYFAPVRYPRAELVSAVFAAADRWLADARASDDPEQAGMAPDVAAAVAEARAAMSS